MVIRSVMSLWKAMCRMKSQGTCSIDHSLIMLPKQSLVLIAKRGTIETIVDIGEKVAVLKRRRNRLHMAGMEGMVQNIMAHLEAIKFSIEVTIAISLKSLVKADLILVVFADDTDFSSRDRVSPS